MKCIKRIVMLGILLLAGAMTGAVFAEITDFDGGLSGDRLQAANTYEYSEVTFITGRPVTLTGTVTITTGNKALPTYPMVYKYALRNRDEGVTLARTATYSVVQTVDGDLKQTTAIFDLTDSGKITETYSANGATYTLGKIEFEKSALYDNTAAVDYLSGSLYSRRTLYKNGDYMDNDGYVTIVSSSDGNFGYRHKWGSAESMAVHQTYKFADGDVESSGTVEIGLSTLDKTTFRLNSTKPLNISFRSNYVQKVQRETVMSYSYDMPKPGDGDVADSDRVTGRDSMKRTILLDSKSLITPRARDIYGITGETSLFFTLSLKLFDDSKYYSPKIKITRMDFSKALAKAMSDVQPLTQSEIVKRTRPGFQGTIRYSDIKQTDPDIAYLEVLQDGGVITGEGKYFYPDKKITRQEAVTMMIRSLGLTGLAPTPPYKTKYTDDSKIGGWAKDSAYAAYEIGLERGYSDRTFKPQSTMTKAEASIMIKRYIDHIREVINSDYREKVIN